MLLRLGLACQRPTYFLFRLGSMRGTSAISAGRRVGQVRAASDELRDVNSFSD